MNPCCSTALDAKDVDRHLPDSLHTTECACTALRRASRSVTQLYDLVLAPLGLKATQFVVLQAIGEHGSIPQWLLAREYAVAVETLSRRLASLRKAGWVELSVKNRNGEHVYCLTAEGLRLLTQAEPFWKRAQARLGEALQAQHGIDLGEIIRLADKLSVAAREAQTMRVANRASTNPGSTS